MLAETYPVQLACQVLDCARSSYYYQAEVPDESQLKERVRQVAGQWPTYGYRRLKKQLERDTDQVVNHKKMRRLMRELGLVVKKKAKNDEPPTLNIPGRVIPIWSNSCRLFDRTRSGSRTSPTFICPASVSTWPSLWTSLPGPSAAGSSVGRSISS